MRFGIPPVPGRMPGDMNVLLAEVKMPDDTAMEMDDVNEGFPGTNVTW